MIEDAPSASSRYCVLFDPLDGSSNLDVGGAVGTIFSIYEVSPGAEHRLQRGRSQVAAGYVLYGPATTFVVSLGQGVDQFVLEPAVGNFLRVGTSCASRRGVDSTRSTKPIARLPGRLPHIPRRVPRAVMPAATPGRWSPTSPRAARRRVFLYPPTTKRRPASCA